MRGYQVIAAFAAACIVAVLAAQAAAVSRLRSRRPGGVATTARPAAHAAMPATSTTPVRADGGWLVTVLRQNRWLRRSLSLVSVAGALVAVGMIGYPFYTNLYADRVQDRLERQFTSDELRSDYQTCREVGVDSDACRIDDGDSLTRIEIPDIDIDVVVVEGVSSSALRAGAGHYPSTPLPCEHGNVGIAGHRTTYGRPFQDLDLLEPGDEIRLHTPIGTCTYRVTGSTVVPPDDVGVLAGTGDDRLTLTTCHPKGSARERLVLSAELTDSPFVEA